MSKQNLVLYTADGEEKPLPVKWCICGQCEGSGKSSAYLGAFTQDEMDEQGPEFMEDYIDGAYDRACDRCDGTGKVQKVDWERLSPDDAEQYEIQLREDAEERACRRMEERMGA